MASRAPVGPFIIYVTFEPREDGGLRAYAEKVPGFLLSHSDPEKVMRDVEPALSVILSEMYGHKIKVTQAVEVSAAPAPRRRARAGKAGKPNSRRGAAALKMPAHLCSPRSYVGLAKSR
jgi:hypothetical protein